jgi:hypothetical protein
MKIKKCIFSNICLLSVLVCTDPVDAEYVLKTCMEKDDILKFVRILTGNGSIFAPGRLILL